MVCTTCHEPLNTSRTITPNNKELKSCPHCSVKHGEQHIYFDLSYFGTSSERISAENPRGIQSYCTLCRKIHTHPIGVTGITCSGTLLAV